MQVKIDPRKPPCRQKPLFVTNRKISPTLNIWRAWLINHNHSKQYMLFWHGLNNQIGVQHKFMHGSWHPCRSHEIFFWVQNPQMPLKNKITTVKACRYGNNFRTQNILNYHKGFLHYNFKALWDLHFLGVF